MWGFASLNMFVAEEFICAFGWVERALKNSLPLFQLSLGTFSHYPQKSSLRGREKTKLTEHHSV